MIATEMWRSYGKQEDRLLLFDLRVNQHRINRLDIRWG